MALRRVATAMLIAGIALPIVCFVPTEEIPNDLIRRPIEPDLARQNIDAHSRQEHQQAHTTTVHDLDLPYGSITFGLANLAELKLRGSTTLELPGFSPITLTMERISQHTGITSMTLSHQGLTSTLSHRGKRFHLSLATPYGSYRIEGDADDTRYVDNRVLNQRMIAGDTDYRYVH